MAITMKSEGIEEMSAMLNEMDDQAQRVASFALYEGAGIVADEVNKYASSIHTEPFHYAVFVTREPSPEEKEIVQTAAAGIAKFNKNGSEVDTSVGFQNSGYAELKGKMVPIPKIVNAINSGTSFMKKQPFVRKAANSASPKAMEAMRKYIEAEFEAIGRKYKASMK